MSRFAVCTDHEPNALCLAAVTGPQLVSLRVSNLCDLAYSLALLRVKPSQRWIAALIQAVDGSEPVLKHVSKISRPDPSSMCPCFSLAALLCSRVN
jgi:hypothetical protein